jgi:hypothetical protein
MTNPTSNFNWQMPTASDLVTDLPADFETFGQAVDTTLADLKGGTSGQILAKASNTDMDFTWVTNDVGDITAVTAGTGITGGGTSGAVTVSFDQANYGGGQFAAGKNKIINGDFSINQRNFSSTTTSAEFNVDRWRTIYTGGTSTTTVPAFTLGTAPVAGYEGKNYYSVAITGQSASTDFVRIQQVVESVRTFAGQTATYSFWASAGTPKVAVFGVQFFGQNGSPSATVSTDYGTITLSTTWTRYSVVCAIPSIAGKTLGTLGDDALSIRLMLSGGSSVNNSQSIGVQNYTFDTWGHQLEAGSIATPFQLAGGGNPQPELALCQRYYERITANAAYGFFGFATTYATTAAVCTIPFKTRKRTTVYSVDTSAVGTLMLDDGNTAYTFTTAALSSAYNNADYGAVTVSGSSGMTQYRPANLVAQNSSTAYIGFSAEL